ncbi:MAG: hypothetical protein JJE17_08860 [Peptostreptococcaceae bacterium]|nr:hypothetical protein [Peptostreptococcaceae bacterium]
MRFLAAGQQAKVFLNGEEMIHHFGGYSTFTCELSGKLKSGDNQVDVWVSNASDNTVAPISGDFNFYGGLYRGVQLISAPTISISRKYYGGQGVRIWSEKVSDQQADLNVKARIDNGSDKKAYLNLLTSLVDPLGKVVASGSLKLEVDAGHTQLANIPMPEVMNPKLWSPEDPTLYQLKIEVK